MYYLYQEVIKVKAQENMVLSNFIITEENMKISIVIPIYNVEDFLKDCIESVLVQTYSNIEIILVNDGSTDSSPEICEEYALKDKRIKVVHKENGGLSDARNVGLETASGEYVYFLDSDDLIEPFAIEDLVNSAQSSNADVILFDARVINEDGSPYTELPFAMRYYRVADYSKITTGKEMFKEMLINDEYCSAVPLMFIRKSAIKNKFIPILHEDEIFTVQLLYSAKTVAYHSGVLYIRRNRQGSITTGTKSSKHYTGVYKVIEELVKIPNRDESINKYICRLYRYSQTIYHQLSKEDKKIVKNDRKGLNRIIKNNYFFGISKLKLFYYFGQACVITNPLLMKILRIPYRLLKKCTQKNKYKERINALKINKGHRRIILIGAPIHGNLGDHAIIMAEKQLFKKILSDVEIADIEMPFYKICKKDLKKCISSKDVIVISGGGWLGNQWIHNEYTVREIISSYPYNTVIIMPQTIYYETQQDVDKQISEAEKIYSSHDNLLLCLRDFNSYEFAKIHNFKEILYVPDIALYLNYDNLNLKRSNVLLCKREDIEKVISDNIWTKIELILQEKRQSYMYTTTVVKNVAVCHKENAVMKKLKEFASSKLVITDRLHAMIFSAITGTPCIAFDNTSKKVSGVYEWIKNLKYIHYVDNLDSAIVLMYEILNNEPVEFTYDSPNFNKLIDEILIRFEDKEK